MSGHVVDLLVEERYVPLPERRPPARWSQIPPPREGDTETMRARRRDALARSWRDREDRPCAAA